MLGVAESCTGGLIASMLTEVSGASSYFSGGLITYANHTKHDLLGVSNKVLKTKGAVSKETALQMARGARKILKTQWAISGGTLDKPVGLVYYSVVGPKVEIVKKNVFQGTRKQIQRATAKAVLQLLASLLG